MLKEYDFDNSDKLVEELRGIKSVNSNIKIGIDGFNGTGKSNLAYRLGADLVVNTINIDDFLTPNLGGFLEHINYGNLRQRCDCFRNRPLIIEGCCLLNILEIIDIKCEILVYCRDISEGTRLWHDGDIFINAEYYAGTPSHAPNSLEADLFAYHKKYKPWECANYIYNIINQKKY